MEPKETALRILNVKIFSPLSQTQAERVASSSEVCRVASGEEISSSSERMLSVVLKGTLEVFSTDNGRATLLRILREGDVFGVAGLFSGSEPVSRIIAKSKSQILLIPRDEIITLMTENKDFARGYISFLEKRIAFLNNRISSFTAGSCERKLALFLCSVSEEESFSLSIPFSSLAKQLDMGRASFYRALGILEGEGLVSGNEKKISVISRKALKAKYV